MSRLCRAVLFVAAVLFLHGRALAWDGVVRAVSGCEGMTVESGVRAEEVELYGIACPDEGQPYARDARKVLSHLVLGRLVEVTPMVEVTGGKSRALVRTMGNGCLINERLVSHGMAWVSLHQSLGRMIGQWKKIERLARHHRIGLWADRSPLAPWDWKRRRIGQMLDYANRQG